MPDTAPAAVPTCRLLAWWRFGRTSSIQARRGVSTNKIDSDHGEDCSAFLTAPEVTVPYADGVRGGIWDGYQGSQPRETVRYQPDNINGVAATGVLHANARRRALGDVVDGGGTQTWLTDGCATACAGLTAMGYWWGVYSGKFGYPTFAPTDEAPHNWPLDISHADYDSLTNWRAMFEPALAGGCGFICIDAAGGALATDCEKYFQDCLETAATHTGVSLGQASFTGSFVNDRVRRMYVEAVANMDTTSWASSWAANYDQFEASVGDADEMQIAECDYPPIVICIRCADADDTGTTLGNLTFLYNKTLEILAAYPTVFVAVDYYQMKQYGFDMAALIEAADGAEAEEEEAAASSRKRVGGNPGWVLRSAGFQPLR